MLVTTNESNADRPMVATRIFHVAQSWRWDCVAGGRCGRGIHMKLCHRPAYELTLSVQCRCPCCWDCWECRALIRLPYIQNADTLLVVFPTQVASSSLWRTPGMRSGRLRRTALQRSDHTPAATSSRRESPPHTPHTERRGGARTAPSRTWGVRTRAGPYS